jgi:hypothetical protein
MKKFLLILVPLFLVCIQKAYAEPSITNITLQPRNIWFGENISISLTCYDSAANITQVYGRIEEPIISEDFLFEHSGNNWYVLELTSLNFDPEKPPIYTFSVHCKNENNETDDELINFNVSSLFVSITSIKTPVYLDDFTEMIVSIKKDDSPLNEGVKFKLKLSGQEWSKTSSYDPEKEAWTIRFRVPDVVGVYNLELEVDVSLESYNPKKTFLTSSIEVKEPVEFRIISLDKTEVKANDTIKVSLLASERGSKIILKTDYLSFQIGSSQIEKDRVTISSSGDYFNAEIKVPDLSPGSYDLRITLNYKNYSITRSQSIGYVMSISGKIVDLSGNRINTEIRFLINEQEKKRLSTDSSGAYSGYIVPGTYTVQLTFPRSTLYLYDVTIDEFDDPIKHYYFDTDIEGVKSAGLFVYDVDLDYKKAKIIMNYDETKVPREKDLVVYRCSEFNPANKICDTEWKEEIATIDTVRNTATIETDSLSAFVIGMKKSLVLDVSFDKNIFGSGELIKLRGIVRDESGSFVSGAEVKATISTTNINSSAFSDENGVFNIELFSPKEEGTYNLFLKAEKIPYISSNKSLSFQVKRTRSLSLVVPDTIKIKQGENQTLKFSVINTGQVDLSDLSLFLTGLPQNYYSMQESIKELKVNEEVKIPVEFRIPRDATETTISITFKVNSSEVSKEEIIGFTIVSENVTIPTQTKSAPLLSIPTGAITFPVISVSPTDITYASFIFVASILVAFVLRKNRSTTKERRHIKNLLYDVKNEIRRRKVFQKPQATEIKKENEK